MSGHSARPVKVGLLLPVEQHNGGHAPGWAELAGMARHAEAVGFDSLWLPDHLVYDFAALGGTPGAPPWGVWECWSVLSALAAVTGHVELGPFVACTGFRNPALLAKMAATVDEISGSRLVLGLGAGYHEVEFRRFGYPFDHPVSRFDEALQVICPLLRTGAVDFRGRYHSAPECELGPRGPRANGPPILIGAKQPRTRRLAARDADLWNGTGIGRAEDPDPAREALDQACTAVGHDPATLARTLLLLVDLPGAYADPYAAEMRRFRGALRPGHVHRGGGPRRAAARLRPRRRQPRASVDGAGHHGLHRCPGPGPRAARPRMRGRPPPSAPSASSRFARQAESSR